MSDSIKIPTNPGNADSRPLETVPNVNSASTLADEFMALRQRSLKANTKIKGLTVGIWILGVAMFFALLFLYRYRRQAKANAKRADDIESGSRRLTTQMVQLREDKAVLAKEAEDEKTRLSEEVKALDEKYKKSLDDAIVSQKRYQKLENQLSDTLKIQASLDRIQKRLEGRVMTETIPERLKQAEARVDVLFEEKVRLEEEQERLLKAQVESAKARKEHLTCPICCEIYRNPVSLITVPENEKYRATGYTIGKSLLVSNKGCLHSFCGNCAQVWLKQKNTCPTCRRPVIGVNDNGDLAKLAANHLKEFPETYDNCTEAEICGSYVPMSPFVIAE